MQPAKPPIQWHGHPMVFVVAIACLGIVTFVLGAFMPGCKRDPAKVAAASPSEEPNDGTEIFISLKSTNGSSTIIRVANIGSRPLSNLYLRDVRDVMDYRSGFPDGSHEAYGPERLVIQDGDPVLHPKEAVTTSVPLGAARLKRIDIYQIIDGQRIPIKTDFEVNPY